MSSSISVSAINVDLPDLNPYCDSFNTLFLFKNDSNLMSNNFSNIFENCGKSDIGLLFVKSDLFPDLNIGTTFAVFILSGNTPVLKDLLTIFVSGFKMTSMHFLTVSILIL